MARIQYFKTFYNDQLIKVTGNDPAYTVTWPDGKAIIIERFADGWFIPEDKEQHWTDAEIAAIGKLIEKRTN